MDDFAKDMKRRGLGRGLSALFDDEEQASANDTQPLRNDGHILGVDQLQPGQYQPRQHFDHKDMDQLIQSVKEHGVVQPLIVRPVMNAKTPYEIIAGERRWRAAQKAGLHEVPVVIREMTDTQALEIALVENLQRVDLDPIEEAEGLQRLVDEFAHSHEVMAQKVGKSRSHVTNILRLLALPAPVQFMVREGTISAGHARALIGLDNAEELAKQIVNDNLSVRDIEKLSALTKNSGKAAKKSVIKDADTLALEKDLSNKLGMRVFINNDPKTNKGSIQFQYDTMGQLDDLVQSLLK